MISQFNSIHFLSPLSLNSPFQNFSKKNVSHNYSWIILLDMEREKKHSNKILTTQPEGYFLTEQKFPFFIASHIFLKTNSIVEYQKPVKNEKTM